MGKGLKMFNARHERSGGRPVPVADIKQGDRDDLICEFCAARISYVSAYTRNGKRIAAFLRLQKNVEHALGCSNNVENAVKSLVAQSHNTEHNKALFDNNESGYTFRMNVLINAIFDAVKEKKTLDAEEDQQQKVRRRVQYQQTEKRLADYFSSAAGIAKIRANIEEKSDKQRLSELITIDYNGQKISWNDFYYEEDRYPALFRRAEKIKHPIAILLTVKETVKLVDKNTRFYTLKGDVSTLSHGEKSKEHYSPSVNSCTREFLTKFKQEEEIIVIGFIKTKARPWKSNIIYKNMSFWITSKKQVTKINS